MPILTFNTRSEWLAARKGGLGASDIPVVLGESPFKTPYALWAEKCGMLPDEDLAREKEAVDWGLTLEAPIAYKFGERLGRTVEVPVTRTMHVHPDYPFLRSTLDALQWKGGITTPPGDLQIKTTHAYNLKEWKDGQTPLMYEIQVAAELFVSGLTWGSLACLIGGQRLECRDIERDDDFIDAAMPHLERFWEHVEKRIPPQVDASDATRRVLAKMHPNDNGQSITLPAEAAEWQRELEFAKEKIAALKVLKELNENRLRAAIGDYTFGDLPDGSRLSLKTQTRREHVVAESTFRVLRST